MFNHHPDVLHYAWRAFTELGHTVHFASEELTNKVGFKYSSTKGEGLNCKFEVVDRLFEPHVLFPDMKGKRAAHFVSGDDPNVVKNYDIVWSMLPEVTSLRAQGIQTWYDCQMQGTLRNPNIQSLPGIKTCNHPDAGDFNFKWMPNWVDQQPDVVVPQYVIQLITELNMVDTTAEMLELREKQPDVYKVYGGNKCPDGFYRDVDILPYTAMLVHNKDFGCNCYAVCKALDMGIPVYMSAKTKTRIGFDDLPDGLFYLAEEWAIEEAYQDLQKCGAYPGIQTVYRGTYSLERTTAAVEEILGEVAV